MFRTAGEDADLPISMEADRIHIPLQTDVPSLRLEQPVVQGAASEGRVPLSTLARTSSACDRTGRGNSEQKNGWGSIGTGAKSKGNMGVELGSCGASALETFMMLRSGATQHKRRAATRLEEEQPEKKKKGLCPD